MSIDLHYTALWAYSHSNMTYPVKWIQYKAPTRLTFPSPLHLLFKITWSFSNRQWLRYTALDARFSEAWNNKWCPLLLWCSSNREAFRDHVIGPKRLLD
jgi:hypothetical protein